MLNWGIIGAGGIAYVFCNGMRFTDSGRILAVASRTQSRAEKLTHDFGIAKQYSSYDALLEDEEIDAVYISTIHPFHAEWAIKAAKAKKHMLVEKPISMNVAETEEMVHAARENDVFLMEAFMYRCHPQIQSVIQLIHDGAIGQVQVVRATFGYRSNVNPESRIYNREMGGGAILDIGCYTASMARLIAGAAGKKPFLNPTKVKGSGNVGSTGVDEISAATLCFENGVIAEVIAAVRCRLGSNVTIYGTEGTITIPDPWLPSSPCRHAKQPLPAETAFPPSKIFLEAPQGKDTQEIVVDVDRDLFSYEADMVANHIEARQSPAMSWDDTLGNMQLLDTWRKEAGA